MLLLGSQRAHPSRRGAALLLAFLVLLVIIMVTYQISRTTGTDHIETNRNLVFTTTVSYTHLTLPTICSV